MEVNMNTNVGAKDFQKIVVLGEGGYGKIFLVQKLGGWDHGRLYALKQVRKTTNMTRMGYFLNERHVLERVRGRPFLATLHYAFETATDLNVVLDYVNGGDIFNHKLLRGRFSEACVKFYVSELVLALEHLHELKIVHRDVKPENILIDSGGHVVLTDFGFSKFVSCDKMQNWDSSGTLAYLPPEVIQKKEDEGNGYAVDWWALGVATFELLTGHAPFTSSRQQLSKTAIFWRILKNTPMYPSTLSNEARDFISCLLNKDPNNRLGTRGAEEVKQHPFFKGINWSDVAEKKVPVPFLPCLMNEVDVRYFPAEYTNMALEEPADVKPCLCTCHPGSSSCPTHLDDDIFKGFSYVGPAINPLDIARIQSTSAATANTSPQPRHPSDTPCDTRVSEQPPRAVKRRCSQSDVRGNFVVNTASSSPLAFIKDFDVNRSPRPALAIGTSKTRPGRRFRSLMKVRLTGNTAPDDSSSSVTCHTSIGMFPREEKKATEVELAVSDRVVSVFNQLATRNVSITGSTDCSSNLKICNIDTTPTFLDVMATGGVSTKRRRLSNSLIQKVLTFQPALFE